MGEEGGRGGEGEEGREGWGGRTTICSFHHTCHKIK